MEDETKCQHNDNGATDSGGNGCVDFYEDYSEYRCGDYDDDDFTALEMCCTCKGNISQKVSFLNMKYIISIKFYK